MNDPLSLEVSLTQVRDPSLRTLSLPNEPTANPLHLSLDPVLSTVKAQRVGVSLQRNPSTSDDLGLLRGDAPVESEDVEGSRLGEEFEGGVGSLCEENDGRRSDAESGEF